MSNIFYFSLGEDPFLQPLYNNILHILRHAFIVDEMDGEMNQMMNTVGSGKKYIFMKGAFDGANVTFQ